MGGIPIQIDLGDLQEVSEGSDRDILRKLEGKDAFRMSSNTRGAQNVIARLVPSAIAKKISGIVPENFTIQEVEMSFSVSVMPLIGGGEIAVAVKMTCEHQAL